VELAFRDDLFSHADPDGAAHVADSKPSKFWNVRERFQDHVVQGLHLHQGTVADLEETRLLFDHLACSWVDFLDQFLESHPDRSSVRMKHRGVSCSDGSWVVDYDDLSDEFLRYRRWLVQGFRWRNEIVKGIVHCNSLVPGRVRALLRQVVAQPSAGRHERDL